MSHLMVLGGGFTFPLTKHEVRSLIHSFAVAASSPGISEFCTKEVVGMWVCTICTHTHFLHLLKSILCFFPCWFKRESITTGNMFLFFPGGFKSKWKLPNMMFAARPTLSDHVLHKDDPRGRCHAGAVDLPEGHLWSPFWCRDVVDRSVFFLLV